MNKWRAAFFISLGLNLVAVLAFFLVITIPAQGHNLDKSAAMKITEANGNSLVVNVTKEDFEGIANTYIQKEMSRSPVPLSLAVNGDVSLSSELEVFGVKLPILLRFDPFVQKDGNLLLKQKSVEVGMLDIPPESALKMLRDSVELPDFMEVLPKEEHVLLKLTEIPFEEGISIQATAFDLEKDDIRLRVTIRQ